MRLREDGLDDNILFQQLIVNDMKKGPGIFCCNDPNSGKPLSYGEFYDLHALTMMVISEITERERKTKL